MICQICQHRPARDVFCTIGKRHATAHLKHCKGYQPDPGTQARHVRILRRMAVMSHRDGDMLLYRSQLQAAHRRGGQHD